MVAEDMQKIYRKYVEISLWRVWCKILANYYIKPQNKMTTIAIIKS